MASDPKILKLDDDNGDGGNSHGESAPDINFPGYNVKRNGNIWSFSKSHQGLYLDHSNEYKIPNAILNSEQNWDTGWRRVPYDVDVRSSMFPRHFKEMLQSTNKVRLLKMGCKIFNLQGQHHYQTTLGTSVQRQTEWTNELTLWSYHDVNGYYASPYSDNEEKDYSHHENWSRAINLTRETLLPFKKYWHINKTRQDMVDLNHQLLYTGLIKTHTQRDTIVATWNADFPWVNTQLPLIPTSFKTGNKALKFDSTFIYNPTNYKILDYRAPPSTAKEENSPFVSIHVGSGKKVKIDAKTMIDEGYEGTHTTDKLKGWGQKYMMGYTQFTKQDSPKLLLRIPPLFDSSKNLINCSFKFDVTYWSEWETSYPSHNRFNDYVPQETHNNGLLGHWGGHSGHDTVTLPGN